MPDANAVTMIFAMPVLGAAMQRVFCLPAAFEEPRAIAEVLRAIARFEGGDQAVAGAHDADIATTHGMTFDFESTEQRDRFQARCREFLRDVVLHRVAFDPILAESAPILP